MLFDILVPGGAKMETFFKDLVLSSGKTLILLGILASLFLAFGYIFLPEMLKRLSGSVSRIFELDEWLLANRLVVGIIFLLVCLALSYTLFFVR